ncbi:MAG TPA: hypothetical protein VNZ45_02660 [Bacteroidia bacterium]|jgi:hypothetical protein|nr:hypothetical protein [Bacteroidia bacterium]
MSQAGRFLATTISNPVVTLTGAQGGGAVPPDNSGNITITGQAGISVTGNPGTDTIIITGTGGGGIAWQIITASTQQMLIDNGYVANHTSTPVTFTLPVAASAALGSVVLVSGYGTGGWRINQNASQQIINGQALTTAGTSGHLDSNATNGQYDNVTLRCIDTSGFIWKVETSFSAGLITT